MKNNEIVTPSSQVDSTLPLWIRTPDVVMQRGVETRLDGNELTRDKYRSQNNKNFVNFMEKSAESEERLGFGQDILQNLLKYRDFDTYAKKIVQFNFLSVNGLSNLTIDEMALATSRSVTDIVVEGEEGDENLIVGSDTKGENQYILTDTEEDQMELADGYGFPEYNGVILIDDEVILYRRRVGNYLYNLQRGASATVILPHLRDKGKYVRTVPAEHVAGTPVINLSVLFLVSLLDTIHKTYAHGIDSSRVDDSINRSSLLQNIKDFFRAKGSKLGIKALFKIIFGENDVDVFYPGDRMIEPSESTWSENMIFRVVPIPQTLCDPNEKYTTTASVIGSEVLFKSYNDEELYARGVCDYTSTYQWEGKTQYEVTLNKDSFEGITPPNAVTYLTRQLDLAGLGSTNDARRDQFTITVESTLGFPDKGVLFIDNEGIYYESKTPNQFLNCKRGYIGVNAKHTNGSFVYGPYYVETRTVTEDRVTHVSRSWPLGLVESISIEDPGLLHELTDYIDANDDLGKDRPGRVDHREAILCRIKNEEIIDMVSGNDIPIIVTGSQPLQYLHFNFQDPTFDFEDELEDNLTYTFLENYADDLVKQVTTQPERLAYVGDRTFGVDGIYFDDEKVFVSTQGFPRHNIGMFNTNVTITDDKLVGPNMRADHVIVTLPRREFIKENLITEEETIVKTKGTDTIGIFVNGVRAFSNISPNNIKQGKIGHFKVLEPGFGYKNPTVIISPPNSTAEVVVHPETGAIVDVASTSDGNYIDDPIVRISSGEGAVLTPSFDKFGRIIKVTVDQMGMYYNDVPQVIAVDSTGVGKGALLSCTVSQGLLVEVDVLNTGIDYNSKATEIRVIPVGDGALVKGITEYYSINRMEEVNTERQWKFDDGMGFLYEAQPGRTRTTYGYISSPPILRDNLKDNGEFHSPILGWAFDGNPIYGPFGYSNNTDIQDGVEKQVSSYRLRQSRLSIIPGGSTTRGLNPPSITEYDMGYFVEDYMYDPSGVSGIYPRPPVPPVFLADDPSARDMKAEGATYDDFFIELDPLDPEEEEPPIVYPNYLLDKFNGKVCNTPEFPVELFPDGVYCYFVTTDEEDQPIFPYLIGETFRNRPLPQDREFDFTKVERLRNPYLKSTKRDLQLAIGDIGKGSVDGIVIQDGNPDNSMVGDYIYFDDTDTGGAGAQGIVDFLEGQNVVSAGSTNLTTNIRSHRQVLDFVGNLDENGDLISFTFTKDKEIYTFSPTNFAKATVWDYDSRYWEMKAQVTTTDLIQIGDRLYDNTRKLLSVTECVVVPELEETKRLWTDDLTLFEVGDIVEIDNGSLDEEYRENEKVEIQAIYPDESFVAIRGYEEEPQPVPDGAAAMVVNKFIYKIVTDKPHGVVTNDEVIISGSKYDKLNGTHSIVRWDETSFEFFVPEIYEEEDTITYVTNAEFATGKIHSAKTYPGYGYERMPKILGVGKKFIDRAETKIRLQGSSIGAIDVIEGGNRYKSPEVIIFDYTNSGQGARAKARTNKKGQIKSIEIQDGGKGYIEPAIYLVERGGKFIPTTSDIGKIKSVRILDPGRNIAADLSLRPELMMTTRVIVEYTEGSEKFKRGDQVFQGSKPIMYVTASVTAVDNDRQILTLHDVVGVLKDGEMLYTTDGKSAMVHVQGQADCRVQVNSTSKPEGKFIDDEGLISEAYSVIQDSYYFQKFSYVIASPLQQVEYQTFVNDIIHPSGFIQFADLTIHSDVNSGSFVIDEPYNPDEDYNVRPLLVSQFVNTPILLSIPTFDDEVWVDVGINI